MVPLLDPCLQVGDTTAQKCGRGTAGRPFAGQCVPSGLSRNLQFHIFSGVPSVSSSFSDYVDFLKKKDFLSRFPTTFQEQIDRPSNFLLGTPYYCAIVRHKTRFLVNGCFLFQSNTSPSSLLFMPRVYPLHAKHIRSICSCLERMR